MKRKFHGGSVSISIEDGYNHSKDLEAQLNKLWEKVVKNNIKETNNADNGKK